MIATDSDREGEAIARLIINLSGNSRKTIKRLWINSLETSEIKKGFQNLKDGQSFYSTYKEAETRQIADWLVGINLTRLYTLYMQKNGMRGVFSVGRVQTPTLFLIFTNATKKSNISSASYFMSCMPLSHTRMVSTKGNTKSGLIHSKTLTGSKKPIS
ncbi:DNA topoisomerase [Enterococcus lactis]|nr:DNA topoisomerase [Enterococcus faecium]MDW8523046.1 DNA topoisomerase [Enterococcus lactis]